MRMVLETSGEIDKEADLWFHRVVWNCFPWLQISPQGIVLSEDGRDLVIPVRRALVSGPGFKRFLGLFGSSDTPSKMEYVPATIVVHEVVDFDLSAVGLLPDGWETLDSPISLDSNAPNVLLIGMTEWPGSGWMLRVTIKRLSIEFVDGELIG